MPHLSADRQTSPPPRRRLTQAERRAATRTALLDATIESLVTFGYAGTSTARVAELAGLSRGAQLNYFPSKAALVAAAVQHLADKRIAELRALVATLPEGGARVPAVLDRLWESHQGDVFHATLELWVAARTDAELRESLAEIERHVTREAMTTAATVLAGIAGRAGFRDDVEFALTTVRGLAVLQVSSGGSSRAVARRWTAARERLIRILG